MNRRESARLAAMSRSPREFKRYVNEKGHNLPVSAYFGCNTFDRNKMQAKLPKDVFKKLTETIERGEKLSSDIADSVAHAVKEWAIEEGVTHFCHWFQPMTGSTAEKHDSFISWDTYAKVIERFSGSQLIQSEPDASSFPSGGMRTTFEARGYTAWDPSSPMFVMESVNGRTLCIPSVFISYHGDALDEKTALLRSMDRISHVACDLLEILGKRPNRMTVTVGPEQEYFLIDQAYVSARSDLILAGRTLQGAAAPKGQELEDHYFGSIPGRVLAFMQEVEFELYKLGIPAKTRHNEVAPSQFELAPIFEEANIAADHNQLTMEVMRRVALRHHYAIFFHEKPFAGINGSGKHTNWSISTDKGDNLLEPGTTPHQNTRFLLTLAAVLKGVHKHNDLLRASIASHGNDHRLGANEAPPAIVSVFLGDMLEGILNKIETNKELASAEVAMIKLGVSRLPDLLKDNTDRNRTSPFAFTGNKFEFRAVGGSASISLPVTVLNAAVADGIVELTERIKTKRSSGESLDAVLMSVIKEFIIETKAVRFTGNNYSDEWVKEAAKRGLFNLTNTPDSLARLVDKKNIKLLTESKIFSEEEVKARYHVRLERYLKHRMIEVECLNQMTESIILPAAFRYTQILLKNLSRKSQLGMNISTEAEKSYLDRISTYTKDAVKALEEVKSLFKDFDRQDSDEKKGSFMAAKLYPASEKLRGSLDQLETIVDDDFWPLPKYREMLFSNF